MRRCTVHSSRKGIVTGQIASWNTAGQDGRMKRILSSRISVRWAVLSARRRQTTTVNNWRARLMATVSVARAITLKSSAPGTPRRLPVQVTAHVLAAWVITLMLPVPVSVAVLPSRETPPVSVVWEAVHAWPARVCGCASVRWATEVVSPAAVI